VKTVIGRYLSWEATEVDSRVPGMSHEGLPEIVKGGMGHDGLAARPLKRMRETGGMVAWVHILRIRLPGIHYGWIDDHPLDNARIL
jgi:hypothetical protein